jgi:hypothetical protein
MNKAALQSCGSGSLRKIQPKMENMANIVGKLYCQKGKETKQQDIEFNSENAAVAIGFVLDSFQFALVSKVNGEIQKPETSAFRQDKQS